VEAFFVSHVQTIALAQIAPKLGDVAANLAYHRQYIAEAVAKQADVIVFPELGLTGYQLQDLTLNVARTLQHDDIVALVNAVARST
jgi:NAD+ synthase (glutamine-hydrolysing)